MPMVGSVAVICQARLKYLNVDSMNILSGLTLTPFEWTMSNEFAGSAMEFVIRLCCTGPIDVERFNEAVVIALKHQPLLQANAEIGPTHSTSYWRTASDPAPVIKWLDGDPTRGRGVTNGFQPIELDKEIGFRLYGWQHQIDGQPQTEIRFVFHHACCDGKGGVSFIEHVLCQYRLLKEGNCDAMPRFDVNRIEDRDKRASHSFGIADSIWRMFVVRPKRVANMLLTHPLSLVAATKTVGEESVDPPRQCSTTLDLVTTEQLGAIANSLGATTNLILARELFHVLVEHLKNGEASVSGSRGGNLLRLLIPFSLRNEMQHMMAAANCVSMAYLETKQDLLVQDRAENSVVLPDLVKQFDFIRKWRLQYSWIESIKSYARIWPLIKPFKRSQKNKGSDRRQVATTVLSNLGRVFGSELLPTSDGKIKIGELEIETVHLVLPCPAKLKINFTVNFYSNRLTLDVSYLPSAVARETAQKLLDSWRNRVVAVVQRQSSQSR